MFFFFLVTETDELCASMYSFHSSPEEKNKLLSTLAQHGIETTVDRIEKKKRIRDWIQSSVITEEDEENDSGTTTPSSTHSRTPIAGHISSVRAMEQAAEKKSITSTLKDAANKHIDPRTGIIQQGPSEMGVVSYDHSASSSPLNDQSSNGNTTNVNTKTINENGQIKTVDVSPANGRSANGMTASTSNYNNNGSFRKNVDKSIISSTSKGLLSIGNTFATASVPEIQNFNPIERIHNNSIIMDSGYGSLDKLKLSNDNSNNSNVIGLCSPILHKRSSIKVSSNEQQSKGITNMNDRRHHKRMINNQELNDDDNSGGSDDRGSSGFVNLAGTTMKDTAYDHVKYNKK